MEVGDDAYARTRLRLRCQVAYLRGNFEKILKAKALARELASLAAK